MGTTLIQSPRRGLNLLKWYANAMDGASGLMCFTGAFGINKVFLEVFRENKDYLRYVLLEKWGVNEQSAADTENALSNDRDIQVAIGTTLPGDAISHWLPSPANGYYVPFVKLYIRTRSTHWRMLEAAIRANFRAYDC